MSEELHVSGESTLEAAAPVEVAAVDLTVGEVQEDQTVPLHALQQERAQRQGLQEELRMIKDHLSLLQANQVRQKEPEKDEFEGLSDGDVMTVGEFKKVAAKFNQQFQMNVEELRMTQKYPNYQEVVSKHLPEILKNNPGLHKTLQQTQDYELAYYLAKNSDSYKSQNKTIKRNADAERILKNAQQSGSLSSAGGISPMNAAKRYKDMSDEDFIRESNKNRGYT
ncbi:MAG: hypothetical protein ACRDAI_05690 [Candidatus Rhabdochlamydia sp.]